MLIELMGSTLNVDASFVLLMSVLGSVTGVFAYCIYKMERPSNDKIVQESTKV